ncbi:hypothetical protein TcCL_NonESM08189 [Trypanosoma cruzi]|nr:hypothetical protein TcCL_NonESM08189 [Trypanosoma cruzi]
MSCRLSSTIMSATPNAYWHTCSMRRNHPQISLAVMHCILLSFLCLEQTLTPLDPRPGCCERLPRGATFVEEANVWEQRPPSLPHTYPLPLRPHKRAVSWGREARRTVHAQGHKQKQRHPCRNATKSLAHRTHTAATKETGGYKSTTLFFTSHFPDGLALRPTLTVRHGAHHPLPSLCIQQAGAQSPQCHRNGEHKQSSSRTIGATSRKGEVGACQQHSQQMDTQ